MQIGHPSLTMGRASITTRLHEKQERSFSRVPLELIRISVSSFSKMQINKPQETNLKGMLDTKANALPIQNLSNTDPKPSKTIQHLQKQSKSSKHD